MTTPDASEAWIDAVLDAVVSDILASGYFRQVNEHESQTPPTSEMTADVWGQSLEPIELASGLTTTSARIIFTVRVYSILRTEQSDRIDRDMWQAASNLMRRYHDDFDFGGVIRNVDLLGTYGVKLGAVAGYLPVADGEYRIIDITVPCLINDVWPQVQ